MLLNEMANAATPNEVEDSPELPDIIPNSECQLDADISCYYVGWTDIPLGKCIDLLKKHIEIKRLMLGCEIINTHTTHGNKAGRNKVTVRSIKTKKSLHALRNSDNFYRRMRQIQLSHNLNLR